MAPRRRCPVCRSKQWHKEPSTGLITCSEGHVLQNYRSENNERDEFGPHALRKRTLKSGRKKRERESNADPKLYHGDRARFHYFQCLQILLRKQIEALTRLWNLPPEFELVCRDLWALYISVLPSPPPPEPWLHAHEDGEAESADPGRSKGRKKASGSGGEGGAATERDKEPGSPSSSSEEDSDEMNDLLRGLSDTSSSEEEDAERDSGAIKSKALPRSEEERSKLYDRPICTLAVMSVACWTLRLPIIYMDLLRLAENYSLPYLDPIQRHIIPKELAVHLSKYTVQALSPSHVPPVLRVHTLASRFARRVYKDFGVFTAEINTGPVLWRTVRALGGTPSLYSLAKSVAKVLSLPLTLHHTLAPGLERVKNYDPEWHQADSAPPEIALAAVVIVVLKLVYGLDGKRRWPSGSDDAACALPELQEYLMLLDTESVDRTQDGSNCFYPLLDLDNDGLDEYLDFCETALLAPSDQQEDTTRNVMTEYFALERDASHAGEAEGVARDKDFPAVRASVPFEWGAEGGYLRPGQEYQMYKSRDRMGVLPEPYDGVVQRAFRWTGVGEDEMCRVVEGFERRLVRWGKKREGEDISVP